MSIRDRQKAELLRTIADCDEVIARASTERDAAIRQCGLLDALDLLESAAFPGGPVDSGTGLGEPGGVALKAKPSLQAQPSEAGPGDGSGSEYRLTLIDGEAFEEYARDLNPRHRRAALRMLEMLEQEHPNGVPVRTIDESIDGLNLCPLPTFSKIKRSLNKTCLIEYNSSKKTYFIPNVETVPLERINGRAIDPLPAGG